MVLLYSSEAINVDYWQEVVSVCFKQLNSLWIIVDNTILDELDSTVKHLLNCYQLSGMMRPSE